MKKCVLHVYLFILIHLSTVSLSPSLFSSYISLSPIFPSLHSSNGSTVLVPGSEILSYQGYKTSWLWYDMIGLGGLAILFLTLTYITLRLIKKEK